MRTSVTFPSAGLKLAAHLYIPDNEEGMPRPALVVGPSSSGVKEQASGLYAERLSREGFVALAFDPAFQGESEGEPRGLEDPTHRTEDFKAAVSYLATRHDVVDSERIGALGICGSGGYVLAAAGGDDRIKAVGTVAAADVPRHFRYGGDGTQDPKVFQGMLEAAAAARTAQARGEGPQTFPLFPTTAEEAFARGGEYGREGFEYYCTPRGQHPRSAKHLPWISVDRMTFFDAFQAVDLITPRPILLIVGSRAVTSWMSVDAYQRAQEPKELHWIDGASHVDLYDKNEYVTPAVAKLSEFYKTNISAAAEKLAFAG
jgi:fermentation-respiration switch protein FrsA (DUF1100 family)